jgi:hypothetical protein
MSISRGGRPIATAMLIAISAAAGAGVFALLGRGSVTPVAQLSRSQPSEPPQQAVPTQRTDHLWASALDQRLHALEVAQQEKPPTPVTDPGPAPEAVEPPSAREIEEQHEERVRAHRAEALDPGWARTTSTALAADFKRNAGTGFNATSVDCRSTTCSVVLEWPSREQALSEWRRALMQPTRANCGRAIVVPERPASVTGPIQATLIMDCSSWVKAGSPMLSEEELPTLAP